jgi:hypothetical protein
MHFELNWVNILIEIQIQDIRFVLMLKTIGMKIKTMRDFFSNMIWKRFKTKKVLRAFAIVSLTAFL